jgi:hypothetical protein
MKVKSFITLTPGRVVVEDDLGGRRSAKSGLRKPPLLQLRRVHFRRRLSARVCRRRRRVRSSSVVAAYADVLRRPPGVEVVKLIKYVADKPERFLLPCSFNLGPML